VKTAEGRARPVPEGTKMPDEDTIAESLRPAQMAKQHRLKTTVDVAQRLAEAITPAVMGLPPADRESESAVLGAIARAITGDVLDGVAATLKDVESADGGKELMSGDIGAIPLAEILQLLQLQRQSGVLRVANGKSSVLVAIRQGLVDFVQARGAAEEFRLGRYFVEKGVVTREQVEEIAQASVGAGTLIGEAILAAGHGTPDDLKDALTKQSSELIYEVLRWPYGRFTFMREPAQPEADAAKLGLGVAGLVLEGFRRVDEWRLMESTINFDQVVYVEATALAAIDAKLTRTDRLVLGAVDGARTVSHVIKESAVGSFDAIKAVYQLLQSRVLRPRAATA
jgi:hypothetical protein